MRKKIALGVIMLLSVFFVQSCSVRQEIPRVIHIDTNGNIAKIWSNTPTYSGLPQVYRNDVLTSMELKTYREYCELLSTLDDWEKPGVVYERGKTESSAIGSELLQMEIENATDREKEVADAIIEELYRVGLCFPLGEIFEKLDQLEDKINDPNSCFVITVAPAPDFRGGELVFTISTMPMPREKEKE